MAVVAEGREGGEVVGAVMEAGDASRGLGVTVSAVRGVEYVEMVVVARRRSSKSGARPRQSPWFAHVR